MPLVPDWLSFKGDYEIDDPPDLLRYPRYVKSLGLWGLRNLPLKGDKEGVLP